MDADPFESGANECGMIERFNHDQAIALALEQETPTGDRSRL
jgi:hypothetical protein